MNIQQFKLAVLSLGDFSDAEVEKFFLNLEVNSEDDIREAIGILSIHRPKLLESLTAKYLPFSAA
jgi:hypothetical protein